MHEPHEHAEAMTVSELAEATGKRRHRVEYLLDARRIRPSRRVGNCRLYPPATLDFLRRQFPMVVVDLH